MQEVSRNFLKDRVERHEVEFVLLAGDHSILPPRSLCGSAVCGHVDAVVRRKGYWALHLDDDLKTSNTHYPGEIPSPSSPCRTEARLCRTTPSPRRGDRPCVGFTATA